jgi:hypothetical protein
MSGMGLKAQAANDWQNLYEAYGINPADPKADNLLSERMIENPPREIALKIVRFTSSQGEVVPLDVEMIAELGKSASASTSFEWENDYFRMSHDIELTVRYERDEDHETAAVLLWEAKTHIKGSRSAYIPGMVGNQWVEVKEETLIKKNNYAGFCLGTLCFHPVSRRTECRKHRELPVKSGTDQLYYRPVKVKRRIIELY